MRMIDACKHAPSRLKFPAVDRSYSKSDFVGVIGSGQNEIQLPPIDHWDGSGVL